MRTTVDIPDDLLRRAKIRAAEQGVTFKDLFAAGLGKRAGFESDERERTQGRPLPVRIEPGDWTFPHRTNAELMAAIEREES